MKHLPVISGTPQEGQWLTVSRGKWSARPNWFTYHWLTCSAAGRSCADLRGATGPRREVAATDVGHTLRVLVTAGNAAGFRKVVSAATATVSGRRVLLDAATQAGAVGPAAAPGTPQAAPPAGNSGEPPSASFIFAPIAPVVGRTRRVRRHRIDLPGWPVRLRMVGDGSEKQPLPPLSPLGDGPTLLVAFPEPGVEHIRLTVTDAAGRSATVEHDVTVSPEAVPPPVNTALPVIAGSAVEGQSLSAGTGTWTGAPTSYAYRWEDCNAAGGSCSNIASATKSSYKLVASDVGHTVRVVVTATNAGGSTPATSAQTGIVAAAPVTPPKNTALPTISGPAIEGQSLSAGTGTWTGSPTSYTYQWQDCNAAGESCSSIAKATKSSYSLLAGDVGHTLRVVVTATNAGGSTPATSAQTGTVTIEPAGAPTNTALPAISGSLVEGQSLSASTGSWTGSPTSYAYQWEVCNTAGESCSNATSATKSTYKLPAGDVGHTVRVVVTATNASGSTPATSAATATVLPVPPTNTGLPTTTGLATEGQTLSANVGTWTGSPTSFGYKWEDCNTAGESCSTIASATASTYKIASTDVGHTLRVIVTATNAGGSTPATSAPSTTVQPLVPSNTALPVISGTAKEGQSLSASTGSWTGSPTSFAYQWEDCNTAGESCSNIAKATKSSYKLLAGDVGHTVRVVVTATNSSGSTPATSAQTGTVTAEPVTPPANTGPPTIGGSAKEGQSLSASTGTWSGSPTSYAYQWEDCSTAGESCANIGGASGSSYLLAASDVGHTLRVVVTATNAGGSTPATSAQTATVTKPEGGGGTINPILSARKCFENPETEGTVKIEECGYAGETNTGPEPGTCCTLETGNKTLSAGSKLEGKEVRGNVTIGGNNVTLRNDRIIGKAGCTGTENGWTICEGSHPALTVGSKEGTTIEHSVVEGESRNGAGLVTECIVSYTRTTTVRYSRWTNCDGAKFDGGGTIEKNFCVDNAEFLYARGQPEHYECTNDDCKPGLLVEKENTFFNVHEQTAVIFTQGTTESCAEQRIEKNFLAGGGWVYYGENSGSFPGLGPEFFTDNRVALATCASGKERQTKSSEGEFVGEGHEVCSEQTPWSGHMVQWTPQTPGGTGYFPQGGSYNGMCVDLIKGSHSERNFVDSNGSEVC